MKKETKKFKKIEIEVNNIHLYEKDIIEVKTTKDFQQIHKKMMPKSPCFNLNGTLYLIAGEVAYLHKTKGE